MNVVVYMVLFILCNRRRNQDFLAFFLDFFFDFDFFLDFLVFFCSFLILTLLIVGSIFF